MRHYYDGSLTVTDDFRKVVQDLVPMAPVKLAGGFVRQDDLGLVDQSPGHCHPWRSPPERRLEEW